MKRAALMMLAAFSFDACAHTAQANDASTVQMVESELTALVAEWTAAEVSHDRAALEGILDDNFQVS